MAGQGIEPGVDDEQAKFDRKVKFIEEAVAAGNKILAVRAMQDTFHIGVQQAGELVAAMQRGEAVDLFTLPMTQPSHAKMHSFDPLVLQQIEELISAGDRINAIKVMRQATGMSLKECIDEVDRLDATRSKISDANPPQVMQGEQPESTFIPSSPITRPPARNKNYALTGFIILMVVVVLVPILIGLTASGGPFAGTWARINPFAAGRVNLEFGKDGIGPGYFKGASFVSVDNNGHIFVGESSGGRIQVFDEKGNYLNSWVARGDETGDIYLMGIAAGRDGSLYAVINSQLYVYEGMTGSLIGPLEHPDGWGFTDVAYAADGSILAAWYKNRDDLIRFDPAGEVSLLLEDAIGGVTGDSEMDMHIAVDGVGNIYELAYFNQGVFIFSPSGRYISRFGSMGDEAGQFSSPRSIAIDNLGKIYISDFPGVMIYANDGRYLDTLAVNGAVNGMTFDDQNNLYLVTDDHVYRYKLK
jgi:outer membrane protein assembly factor BamB/ribosomal protein L7/L12